ncbi:MAG TPA: hypothetical protein VKZ55_11265 [Microthrixaceae bacterium]|nr:hypothetical protein [Microthrixaceae bacterium]
MDRDDGALDWDAAFEALVAQLHPPRHRRIARAAAEVAFAAIVGAVACWMVLRLVSEPLRALGRPWL